MDECIECPPPPETPVVRIAQPAPGGRLTVDLSEYEMCSTCGTVVCTSEKPVVVLTSTEGGLLHVYCSEKCLVQYVMAVVQASREPCVHSPE